jgi:hypothetical protein
MNLNKLPVLIRTEITAAAKSASLPAVYSRALVALEEAVEELSFAKLRTVEISAEGLAAWAKAHQDEKLTKTARELKFRARRTANYIAEQLVKRRREEFISKGGVYERGRSGTGGGGLKSTLKEAGYSAAEANAIRWSSKLPDTPDSAQLGYNQMAEQLRGKCGWRVKSPVYNSVFGESSSPLSRLYWFRNNNARGIARQLTSASEITLARQKAEIVRAWCDEFLKNLPRNVSKAKVSK